MCVGFWSLEHPKYALCVRHIITFVLNLKQPLEEFFAVIETNTCLGRRLQRISIRLRCPLMSPRIRTEMFFPGETSVLEVPGWASAALAGLHFCMPSSAIPFSLDFGKLNSIQDEHNRGTCPVFVNPRGANVFVPAPGPSTRDIRRACRTPGRGEQFVCWV